MPSRDALRRGRLLNCPFCRIASHVEPAAMVYEDEALMAFMDKNPVTRGHLLVAPKAHYETLLDLDADLVSRLFVLVARVAKALWRALRPDGLNVLQNNRPVAWQSIPHVHVHLIPRYHGDGISVVWPARHKSLRELEEVAEEIRRAL